MKKMVFKIKITSTKEKIWNSIWQDKNLRDWSSIIDLGTYMKGVLKESSTVQFISGGGYGVTSYIKKLIPNEYIHLIHKSDTQDLGKNIREDQWTGGNESYRLIENNDHIILELKLDVPEELQSIMANRYPKALSRIKELSESY